MDRNAKCRGKALILLLQLLLLCASLLVGGCQPRQQAEQATYTGWGGALVSRIAGFDCWSTGFDPAHNALLLHWSAAGAVHGMARGLIDPQRTAYLADAMPKELFGFSTGFRHLGRHDFEYPGGPVTAGLAVTQDRLSGICYVADYKLASKSALMLNITQSSLRPISEAQQPVLLPVRVVFSDNLSFSVQPMTGIDPRKYSYLLLPTRFLNISSNKVDSPVSISGCEAYYIVPLKLTWTFERE